MLGSIVMIEGNATMRTHPTTIATQNGHWYRNTSMDGTFVTEDATSDTTPTGGVTRPDMSIMMVITPNHIPL